MKKHDFMYLYDTKWNIPNGDISTGEQRYDESTKKILVSDVRIKRYIRDFIENYEKVYFTFKPIKENYQHYLDNNIIKDSDTGSAAMIKILCDEFKDDENIKNASSKKKGSTIDYLKLLKNIIDVRLFGCIVTEAGQNAALTGAVQFSNLNESVNKVNLRYNQNTTIFPSKISNEQGSIGTSSLVPYSLMKINGFLNPITARNNNLTDEDFDKMITALWHSVNNVNTRTKCNQQSVLFLDIIYKDLYKLSDMDSIISIKTDMNDEDIRSSKDYELIYNFDNIINNDHIEEVRFYTERIDIEESLLKFGNKFKKINLYEGYSV
jgi:CRISPR-associated protein Csh2